MIDKTTLWHPNWQSDCTKGTQNLLFEIPMQITTSVVILQNPLFYLGANWTCRIMVSYMNKYLMTRINIRQFKHLVSNILDLSSIRSWGIYLCIFSENVFNTNHAKRLGNCFSGRFLQDQWVYVFYPCTKILFSAINVSNDETNWPTRDSVAKLMLFF